jgi:hypothetical protein
MDENRDLEFKRDNESIQVRKVGRVFGGGGCKS